MLLAAGPAHAAQNNARHYQRNYRDQEQHGTIRGTLVKQHGRKEGQKRRRQAHPGHPFDWSAPGQRALFMLVLHRVHVSRD